MHRREVAEYRRAMKRSWEVMRGGSRRPCRTDGTQRWGAVTHWGGGPGLGWGWAYVSKDERVVVPRTKRRGCFKTSAVFAIAALFRKAERLHCDGQEFPQINKQTFLFWEFEQLCYERMAFFSAIDARINLIDRQCTQLCQCCMLKTRALFGKLSLSFLVFA
jgi:hypothetical protein